MRTAMRTIAAFAIALVTATAAFAQDRPSLFLPRAAQGEKDTIQAPQRAGLIRSRDVAPDISVLKGGRGIVREVGVVAGSIWLHVLLRGSTGEIVYVTRR